MASDDRKYGDPSAQLPDFRGLDLSKLGPVYGLPSAQQPEYLDYDIKGRDFFGRVCYAMGSTYMLGFTGGAVYGGIEGWRKSPSLQWRIWTNSVLNGMSKQASRLGNSAAVIAFLYTGFESTSYQLELEDKAKAAIATPIFAGLMTGITFKFTSPLRVMALAAAIGTTTATVYWVSSNYLYYKALRRF